jgi:hypothetical protein
MSHSISLNTYQNISPELNDDQFASVVGATGLDVDTGRCAGNVHIAYASPSPDHKVHYDVTLNGHLWQNLTRKQMEEMTNPVFAQCPSEPTTRSPRELSRIGENPIQAHVQWPSLDDADRQAVLESMTRTYGIRFASKFLEYAGSGKADLGYTYLESRDKTTPRELAGKGFAYAPEIMGPPETDTYIHPSGHRIVKATWKSATDETARKPPTQDEPPAQAEPPTRTDPMDQGGAASFDMSEAIDEMMSNIPPEKVDEVLNQMLDQLNQEAARLHRANPPDSTQGSDN